MAPEYVQDAGLLWVRTEIRKGADLVDGRGWLQNMSKTRASCGCARRSGKVPTWWMGGDGSRICPRRGPPVGAHGDPERCRPGGWEGMAPEYVQDAGLLWVRTEIRKGA